MLSNIYAVLSIVCFIIGTIWISITLFKADTALYIVYICQLLILFRLVYKLVK